MKETQKCSCMSVKTVNHRIWIRTQQRTKNFSFSKTNKNQSVSSVSTKCVKKASENEKTARSLKQKFPSSLFSLFKLYITNVLINYVIIRKTCI